VLIILVVIAFLIPRFAGQKAGQVKQGVSAAADALPGVCRTNLTLVRQAISVRRATGQSVGRLEDLKEANIETRCVVGGEPYTFDAARGEVKCPHPGHELL
jgi:hypothetical protein